jgi:hypothetical protein
VQIAFSGAEVRLVSARDGRGVDEWLASTQGDQPGGRRILEIDYDTYAEGEAALGWLNADVELASTRAGVDWRGFCEAVMASLRGHFQQRNVAVGHVKILLSSGSETLIANLSEKNGDVTLRGGVSESSSADLLVNARAEVSPDELESAVRAAVAAAAGRKIQARFRTLRSLRPERPSPTYRYAEVVY